MAEISAARSRRCASETGLPMMECKQALRGQAATRRPPSQKSARSGQEDAGQRGSDRETSFGRIAVYTDLAKASARWSSCSAKALRSPSNDEFRQLADDLAKQLATGPARRRPRSCSSSRRPASRARRSSEQKDDLINRIREVFHLGRIVRIDGPCGGYVHHTGTIGVLVESRRRQRRAGQGRRHAHRRHAAQAVTKEDLDPAAGRKGARDPHRGRPQGRQAREHHRQDGRRPAEELLRRARALRAAVRQGRQARPSAKFAKEAGMKVKRFVPLGIGQDDRKHTDHTRMSANA